jgi:hypothetical protein
MQAKNDAFAFTSPIRQRLTSTAQEIIIYKGLGFQAGKTEKWILCS